MSTLSCIESCAVVAIRSNMGFEDFRLLTSWLDCYQYIYPGDRKLVMADQLLSTQNVQHASEIFKAWLLADLIECTLTTGQQNRILSWMNQTQ